jgi:hypothetical protein
MYTTAVYSRSVSSESLPLEREEEEALNLQELFLSIL